MRKVVALLAALCGTPALAQVPDAKRLEEANQKFVACDAEVERLYPLARIAELEREKSHREAEKLDRARRIAKAKCNVEHAKAVGP